MTDPHLTYGDVIAEDDIRSTYQTASPQIIDAKAPPKCGSGQIVLYENTAAGAAAVLSLALSLPCAVAAAFRFGSIYEATGGISSVGQSTLPQKRRAETKTPRETEHDIHVKLPPLDEWTAKARVVDIEDVKPFKVKRETEHDIHVKLPPLDEWTAKARVADIEDVKPFKVKRENAR